MGKIVISGPQNASLDGVVQDPDGAEGFELGGWFVQFGGDDLEEWNKVALADALGAEAWLLGRRSYEFFGARWRPRSGELADRLNSMPKYVVSSTLVDPEWNNSTVLKGDVVEEVSKLKQELDGEIVVPASYQLGRTLIEHDLVDELRLVVFPVVLGAGERLFGKTSDKKPMRLVDTKAMGEGLVFLTYEFVTEAQLGGYLCGRRLYETMLVWETDPSSREDELGAAFADVWSAIPKVVFSRTLDSVQSNARLAEASLAEEVAVIYERYGRARDQSERRRRPLLFGACRGRARAL